MKETPSVLHYINMAHKRLERLLFGLHNDADAKNKILEVVKAVTFATNLNPDIAIASILLNQEVISYAVRHSIDTAVVSILIAQALNKQPAEVSTIVAAALTMNVGMLRQHDQFQRKQDPLTEAEIDLIRKHPEEGVKLLQQAGITDPDWLSFVLHHHENEDGSGYPHGKSGKDIPQHAKIILLADRYCARVTGRSYRKPLLPNAALRGLFVDESKAIDAQLAKYFVKELGMFPPGTYVRLKNGEIGVVTRKGETATTPTVHALLGPRGALLTFPIPRETYKESFAIAEAIHRDQAAVRISMQQLWGEQASP